MGIMPKRNHLLSLSTTLAAIVALVVLFAGCATTVTPSVVKVAIVGGNVSMNVGTTKKLTATVTVLGGAAKTVTWKSDTTAVATVASDGTVTASNTKSGTAKITATSTVDKTKSATITVTVAAGRSADHQQLHGEPDQHRCGRHHHAELGRQRRRQPEPERRHQRHHHRPDPHRHRRRDPHPDRDRHLHADGHEQPG